MHTHKIVSYRSKLIYFWYSSTMLQSYMWLRPFPILAHSLEHRAFCSAPCTKCWFPVLVPQGRCNFPYFIWWICIQRNQYNKQNKFFPPSDTKNWEADICRRFDRSLQKFDYRLAQGHIIGEKLPSSVTNYGFDVNTLFYSFWPM